MAIIQETTEGLYCSQGDFYIDPWRPVDRAVVTHAHADHARWGCKSYLASKAGDAIFRLRLGQDSNFNFVPYGQTTTINGVKVSLHPAGHMTGSSQVRIEYRGQVAVVSGDYKLQSDPTCEDFEPVRCDLFVTESTFGLPIYQWNESAVIFDEINDWWRSNQEEKTCSVLFGYSVGKAQRLLAGIDSSTGPIFAHGAILNSCRAYRDCGVQLPTLHDIRSVPAKHDFSQALVIAPPSARGSTWLRRFGKVSMGMASGWMQVRGIRRRRVVDRGFIMSDHVDWPGLLTAIRETKASKIWVTHGYTRQVAKWLNANGWDAKEVATDFHGESDEEESDKVEPQSVESTATIMEDAVRAGSVQGDVAEEDAAQRLN